MHADDLSWFLYIIQCRDGSLYTGIAKDVEQRLAEHRAGRGAKYLRGRGPLTLVFRAAVGPKSAALKIERKVKKLTRSNKQRLVNRPLEFEDMLAGAGRGA